MKNGEHTHYCPKCKADWTCQAVTHCQLPDVMLCPDHFLEEEDSRRNEA